MEGIDLLCDNGEGVARHLLTHLLLVGRRLAVVILCRSCLYLILILLIVILIPKPAAGLPSRAKADRRRHEKGDSAIARNCFEFRS